MMTNACHYPCTRQHLFNQSGPFTNIQTYELYSGCSCQAQALLRQSIRDTTAEAEDPDKEHKDEYGSDESHQPKRKNKGRGKGRGGRGRGRGRGKRGAEDALEELPAKRSCPVEMPTHEIPDDLEEAADVAESLAAEDASTSKNDAQDEKEPEEKPGLKKVSQVSQAKKPKTPKRRTARNTITAKAVATEEHNTEGMDTEAMSSKGPDNTAIAAPSTPTAAAPKKHATPRKAKTPKTSPRKARKKKYQEIAHESMNWVPWSDG